MFSKSSNKYFTFTNRLFYLAHKIIKSEKYYFNLIRRGRLPRPHYALGIFLSAYLASELKINKISIIEFGCWKGEALLDIEKFVEDIEKIIKIKIEIYGFDGGIGLPESKNYKDRLYQFTPGEMKKGDDNFYHKLKRSKVFFGQFEETVPNFVDKFI